MYLMLRVMETHGNFEDQSTPVLLQDQAEVEAELIKMSSDGEHDWMLFEITDGPAVERRSIMFEQYDGKTIKIRRIG